jgi:hypothetical protein
MFDQYVKLFNISWIDLWMVEAVAMIVGSFLLIFVVCKVVDSFNGEST